MIDFIDLQAHRARLETSLSQAVQNVMASGFYIGGPKVQELEERLAGFCGAAHVVREAAREPKRLAG